MTSKEYIYSSGKYKINPLSIDDMKDLDLMYKIAYSHSLRAGKTLNSANKFAEKVIAREAFIRGTVDNEGKKLFVSTDEFKKSLNCENIVMYKEFIRDYLEESF